MKLAWKEIIHGKKKYLFIELILVLLIFMVIFLSGLANGLSRAVSAAVENIPQSTFLLSEDSDGLISASAMSADQLDELSTQSGSKVTSLNIQRATVLPENATEKTDLTYFVIDPSSYLNPDVIDGNKLSDTTDTIVLDSSFEDKGIKTGDWIQDSVTEKQLKVVGFTSDALYGHTPVGYISIDTYQELKTDSNPTYSFVAQAAVIKGSTSITVPDGYTLYTKDEIINKIPGYSAEQTTIRMILWVLVVVSGGILGVFFYIITIQKQKQFGVMKAIGMHMGKIISMIILQIGILAVAGVAAGNLAAFLMAAALPASMPFYLKIPDVISVSGAFILISILCGVLSTAKVAKIDPSITIGGNEG